MRVSKLIVLDLDGTVRKSKSGKFIDGPDDVELLPGVAEVLIEYYNAGYAVFGWTNQGGVSHGFKDFDLPGKENKKTLELINGQVGVDVFSDIITSYMDPKGKGDFGRKTFLRKPGIGGFAAIEYLMVNKYGLIPDWANSWFVGDRPEDEESAQLAGLSFIWAHDFFHN